MASLFSSVLLSLCLLSSPFLSNASAHTKLGFTADLIHRDSPKSPFYKPTETSSQRLSNAIHRSLNRVVHFSSKDASIGSPQAEIISNGGEYLMNISLGIPPFPIMVIADTGSDLTWTQCKPCDNCYTQDDPLFDPKASSTYKDVPCSSSQCSVIENQAPSCNSTEDNTCSYVISYADYSYTKGNVAADTLTLGSTYNRPMQLNNFIFGCGYNNTGTFNNKDSGIVGLGGGPLSLISQLGESIDGKFSYCLVPISSDKTSKINFGTSAVVSGIGAVSTPLIKKSEASFYYLTLVSISVGSKNIKFPALDPGSGEGNIIIDSGTTFTMLPTTFYSELKDAVASSIDAERQNNPDNVFSLCYSATADLKIPDITIHFDGADVNLDSSNSFYQFSEDLVCFAFLGSDDLAVYGNLSQMNFLIGYDTVSKQLSFKPADCANM